MVGTSRFIVPELCQLSDKSVGFDLNQKGYTQDRLIWWHLCESVKILFFWYTQTIDFNLKGNA
ncbi:hypothetical protein N409_04975 [Helicobacter pylori FD719]|nr:hypothetical protein N409_04975 [Helicobacter pylori FD719]